MAKKKVVKELKRYLPFDELDYQMDLDWIYSEYKEYKRKLVIIELDVVETGIELESGIVDLDTFDIPSNSTLVVDLNKDNISLSEKDSDNIQIVIDLFKPIKVSLTKNKLPIVNLSKGNSPVVNLNKVTNNITVDIAKQDSNIVVDIKKVFNPIVNLDRDVKLLVNIKKVAQPVVSLEKVSNLVVNIDKEPLIEVDISKGISLEEVDSVLNPIVVSLEKEDIEKEDDSLASNPIIVSLEKDIEEEKVVDEPPTFEARKGAVFVDMSDDDDDDESIESSSVESVEDIEARVAEAYKQKQLELAEEKSKKKNLKKVARSKVISKFVIIGMILAAIALVVVIIMIINWKQEGSVVDDLVEEYAQQSVEIVDYGLVINDVEQNISLVDVNFSEMLQKNSDIVGWLKIDAIDLDYPIVKSSDNEYYLNHDLDKNSNAAGWLFLDYNNSIESIDFNSVIYGHNRRDAVMFGGLKKFLDANVRNKENGKYVYFTTLRNQMIFEICSIYTVEYTNEIFYNTKFIDDAKKQEFIDFIQANNTVEDIKQDLTTADKFLTLSTCHGGSGTTKRLVVHCKLLSSRLK